MTRFWSDAIIDVLADISPDALQYAAAAWRAGHSDGFDEGFSRGYVVAEEDMANAWSAARDLILPVLALSTHAEANALRYPAATARGDAT